MDTSELLRRAWAAVEESGVPESLHEAAFREAVEDLRASESGASAAGTSVADTTGRVGRGRGKSQTKQKGGVKAATAESTTPNIDDDTFFANLAHESGVPEDDLRDVLNLAGQKVHVTQATRKLGTSKAQQARTVTALVAGARAFGIGERPIDAAAVRAEVKRKNCYDENNYAGKALGEMDGFNRGGSTAEMVTTSKWVGEFVAAVNQALGRTEDES